MNSSAGRSNHILTCSCQSVLPIVSLTSKSPFWFKWDLGYGIYRLYEIRLLLNWKLSKFSKVKYARFSTSPPIATRTMKLMPSSNRKTMLVLMSRCVEPRQNRLKTKTKKSTLPRRMPMVDHENTYNDDLKVLKTFWCANKISGGLLRAVTRDVNFGFLVAHRLTYASAMSEIMSRAKLHVYLLSK